MTYALLVLTLGTAGLAVGIGLLSWLERLPGRLTLPDEVAATVGIVVATSLFLALLGTTGICLGLTSLLELWMPL